ncbi:MAG: MarR family transcriptional regulator [Candidatus Thorarchaeota archaeon]
MTTPKIHVAILGNQKTIQHLAVRRRIDRLLIVFPREKLELANNLVEQFSNLGVPVEPVDVVVSDFNSILSSILAALNRQKFDDHNIEFSITTGNCIMTLAACVAAAIVNASVICAIGSELPYLSEVWPSELVNLTNKKHEILKYLDSFNTPVTQKEISRDTGIRPSGVSRHLRDLELAGYIRRYRIARIKQVQITELGSAILHHKQLRRRRIWSSYMNRTSEGIQTVG